MIRAWASSTFLAFSNRGYLVLWLGTTLSFLAFGMSWVVQGVVAFEITGRNSAVGVVSVGMGVATLFVAPFGGVLADRLSKRRLLLVGQSLVGLSFLAVGLLISTGHITILWLALSTFVMGLVFSFIGPARQAWVGELLTGPSLPNGIALQQLGMTVTRVAGPFIAGALIALPWSGSAGTYFVMAGIFVFVVATLWRVPGGAAPVRTSGVSVAGDFVSGLRHLWERPRLLLLCVAFIGFVVGGFSYQVLIPGFIENELGEPPGTIGLLYGLSGLAGLLASVAIAGIAGSRHAFAVMGACGLLLAIGLAWLAVAGGMAGAIGAMLVIGAGSSGYQLLNNSLLMQESAPEYYGRVMSTVMLGWGISGLVAYPYGRLGDSAGERETLALMAALVFLVVVGSAVAYSIVARRGAAAVAPVAAPQPSAE